MDATNAASKEEAPSIKKQSLFSTSAGGASLLIGLQVGSRALTFIVNQVLLRYLSPELLGISTQLEVYSISVLFFARESLRVAIQRQADVVDAAPEAEDESEVPEDHVDGKTSAGRTQTIVNLSYISIFLGFIFVSVLRSAYTATLRSGDPHILATPYFNASLKIYGWAAVWELLSEPAFVVVQQKSRFKIRAAAESIATVSRCIVTCGSAIWAARTGGKDIGVLPYALGQITYAIVLLLVYSWSVGSIATKSGFSVLLKPIYSEYLHFSYCRDVC
jgi:oligosaccharide translocation protein RFT1